MTEEIVSWSVTLLSVQPLLPSLMLSTGVA